VLSKANQLVHARKEFWCGLAHTFCPSPAKVAVIPVHNQLASHKRLSSSFLPSSIILSAALVSSRAP
jgi:hypothetical protein